MAAARVLLDVEQGAWSDEALGCHAPVGSQDRALTWHIALGVLRRRAEIDFALSRHLRRPLASLDAEIRAVLRCGAFERLFSRTRDHAAVHQAVEVSRALGCGRGAGFVNAILRRVRAEQSEDESTRLNTPAWLLRRWQARYGDASTRQWCLSNMEPPSLCVVMRDDSEDLVACWSEIGVSVEPVMAGGQLVERSFRVQGHRGRIEALPGFEEGRFWVQDPAAVRVADLVTLSEGTVLDACAAPGGKTLRLASKGLRMTSTDASAPRLERLTESLRRLGLGAEVRVANWLEKQPELGEFDAVVVDAPCTGLGTVRRNPEIRWRRQEPDLARAGQRQLDILKGVAAHVRVGGQLIYAVCSAEPEEGEDVVRRFVDEGPLQFDVDETLTTAPPVDGEDAFFGVRMVRR